MIRALNETTRILLPLRLDFHHHIILVQGAPPSVEEKLKSEFHFFLTEKNGEKLTLNLNLGPLPELPSVPVERILETSMVFHFAGRKFIDYFGKALTIVDSDKNEISIFSQSEERLFELAFLTIHSKAGDFLDQSGLCRIHAMAISYQGKNAVVMLPSKGGKSTLLQKLLENKEVKIIADDIPLIDQRGSVWAFPGKISLETPPESGELAKLKWHLFQREHYPPKWTASLSGVSERIDSQSHLNRTLLFNGVRLSKGSSLITPTSKINMLKPLLEHMIIGKGLPQIIEVFLEMKPQDFLKMLRHALWRSRSAFSLLKRSETYTFYLGQDKDYNAQILIDQLRR